MKLSEITTADQLVLILARQRFIKVWGHAEAETLLHHGVPGVYIYDEIWWWESDQWTYQLDVMPQGAENSCFGGLSASLDALGNITEWFTWESFAGSTRPVEPDQDLNSVISFVADFLQESV